MSLFAKPFASFHYCKGIIKPEGSWLNSLKEPREVSNLRSVIAFGETVRVNGRCSNEGSALKL